MKALAANVGSILLKIKLFEMPEETALCKARVERVASRDKTIFTYVNLTTDRQYCLEWQCIQNYTAGTRMFLYALASN